MKTPKLWAAIAATTFLGFTYNIKAQTLYTPGGTVGNTSTSVVGIGINPSSSNSSMLQINTTALTSSEETGLQITVSDDTVTSGIPQDYLNVQNGTSVNHTFIPVLWGQHGSSNASGLAVEGSAPPTFDLTTSSAALQIGARNYVPTSAFSGTSTALANRPVIDFVNLSTHILRLLPNSGVAIGGTYAAGTTAPSNGLAVQGYVGIATTSPAYNLDVAGNINYSGNLTNISDQRYKTNVQTLSGSLSKVSSLRGVSYQFNQSGFPEKNFDDKTHLGFIAQEIQKIFPELVSTDQNGFLAVNYVGLIPVLVSAIQEQKSTIDSLKKIIYGTSSNSRLAANTSENIPSTIQLFQNVPNPFDQTTTISYNVPAGSGAASIIIFDLQGKQLQKFDNIPTGNGQIQFDGTQFGAGMYLYSLIVGGKEIDTKRFILTK